ncbi:MAG: hypoxanthine phosphoribosyltransferase [Acidimicrobiales bacterium]
MVLRLDLVTLVVDDHDEAISFFVDAVGFELVEDSPATSTVSGGPKRWVVVRPPGGGTGLLLARAADDVQRAAIGHHAGGRVGLFLHTDDFDAQHRRMAEAGVRFVDGPRDEPCGTVAVWEDLCGNRWDLIGPGPTNAASADEAGHYPPPGEIGEILLTAEQIAGRVAELGAAIAADHLGRAPLLVAVLKGSLMFVADLLRAIPGPAEVDFLAVSSYGAATKSSGVVRIVKDLDRDLAGRDVVLVEDIVDSGLTMRYLLDHLGRQGPASLRTCTLLRREGDHTSDLAIDYVGFRLPPAFVVGYGLDVDQRYRNLPYIANYTGP